MLLINHLKKAQAKLDILDNSEGITLLLEDYFNEIKVQLWGTSEIKKLSAQDITEKLKLKYRDIIEQHEKETREG